MLKEQLIKLIQENIPDGTQVVIFDHRKNLYDDSGEGSSAGIYKDFDVSMLSKEDIADGCIPIAALSFNNEDYEDFDNITIPENTKA